jgi:hypothetical protein
VIARTRAEANSPTGRGEYDRIAAELAAGRRVEPAVLTGYLEAAARAHDEMGEDDRYALRYGLGHLEHLLARGGQFGAADAFYRTRLELIRRDYKFRFRDYRDVSALLKGWAFCLWRFSSRYGTSALRLAWVTFNVALGFTLLYFVLDALALRYLCQRAFATYAMVSRLSYFVVGFEGLFPGTAVFLANNFWAQLVLALENGIGAILILSLMSLVARRVWRGLG